MRILYQNLMRYGSLSATNADANYPVTNLVHPFIRKKFMTTGTSTVITCALNADDTVNCLFLGYHNATSGQIVLKDSGGSTISTTTLTGISGTENYGIYLTESTAVRSFEITLGVSSGTIYCGNIAVGDYLQMPGMNPELNLSDFVESDMTETREGYSIGIIRSILKGYSAQFPMATQAERDAIAVMIREVGYTTPIWCDPLESDASYDPLYCRITGLSGYKLRAQRGVLYQIDLTIKETR